MCVWHDIELKKRNLRSGYLMRPGHVTFRVRGSSCSGNMPICSLNGNDKFGGATRHCFFLLSVQNLRGRISAPAGARVEIICFHQSRIRFFSSILNENDFSKIAPNQKFFILHHTLHIAQPTSLVVLAVVPHFYPKRNSHSVGKLPAWIPNHCGNHRTFWRHQAANMART